MRLKSIPIIIWLVPVLLLVIATARLPYGYYTFARIVTCGVGALIALVGFQERPAIQVWSIPLALIAILFNPFVPIHLNRSIRFYLDLGGAAVFIAHLFFVRQRLGYESGIHRHPS